MSAKVSNYVKNTCRIGQGAACCRFLAIDPLTGFDCLKMTARGRAMIAQRQPHMTAQADNCEGIEQLHKEL